MNTQQLIAIVDHIQDVPEALPRLRKFIFDLAIRGKLIAQDPIDEPHQAVSKWKLVDKSGLAKQLESWCHPPVAEVLNLNYGKGLDVRSRLKVGPIPVYGSNGVVCYTTEPLSTKPSIIVGRKGSAGALNKCRGSSWTTDVAYFIEVPDFFDLDFLYISLSTLNLPTLAKGVKPGLSRDDVYRKRLFIPPLAEQHRIVAKVEELMILCDKIELARLNKENTRARFTKASLERVHKTDSDSKTFKVHARFMINVLPTLTIRESQIRLLRQTILNLAIRGKLDEQKPADTPESEFLAKITTQKKASQTESIHKSLTNLEFGLNKTSFEIPTNWVWATMETVALVNMGQSPPSEFYNQSRDGLPFFQGKADFGERHPIPRNWCTKPSKISECGDILLSVRAPVGPTNVTNRRCCIGRGLAALRPYRGYDSNFMLIVLRALESNLVALGFGTTFTAITKKQLTKFQVPVPPLAEQHSIVAKVDELLTVCDNLRSTLSVREERQIALQESALHHILNRVSG